MIKDALIIIPIKFDFFIDLQILKEYTCNCYYLYIVQTVRATTLYKRTEQD